MTKSGIINVVIAVIFAFSTIACSFEEVTSPDQSSLDDQKISLRSDLTSLSNEVKIEVSQRDNIPVNQITGCYYFGTTTQGYYEYRLQTINNGPKVYFVIGIIGDEIEGF